MKKILTLILCSALCTALLLGSFCVLTGATDQQSATESATESTTESATQDGTFTGTTLPTKANYVFINTALGFASGTLSFDMPEQSNATSFALYWGDAAGAPIKGYTPFMTGDIISPSMMQATSEAFSIPQNAKTILLYTYSEQFGQSTSPYKIDIAGYTLPETGKQICEFVVVSDLHVGSGQTAEKNLIHMLKDVKATSPNAAGIIVAGDAVDAAEEDYYLQLNTLFAKVEGAPKLYCGLGDRAYLTKGSYAYDAAKHAANLQLFLKYVNHPFGIKLDKPYYSYLLGGALMVFIGADSYENGKAVYSAEQLTWLDGILDAADAYEPVFIFMHEPLPNTVSGSMTNQGYGNVQNPEEVKAVLNNYKNIVVFSGHTQWGLEAERTMAYLGSGAHAFNTAGIAHLWDEKDGVGYEVAGSQGYYVTVYEDAVLVRGRDFTTGEWISNAVYMFSTKPTPVQNPQPSVTAKPSTTTKKPASTEEVTEEVEETSVRDLIPPLFILGCMTVIVFIFVFHKPKGQE